MHTHCDSLCDILVKLLRFMKPKAVEDKHGPILTSIDCTSLNLKLPDKETIIEESTRKAVSGLTLGQQKSSF